ncbi:MAG: hypothetical protein ACLGIF_09220 [Actinomycetes bacterium]
MPDPDARHHLFQAARRQAGWSIQQLWVGYLALGGIEDAFHLEAYLHGLVPLAPDQQDIVAIAVNERLYDLYLAVRVPCLLIRDSDLTAWENPVTVLAEQLRSASPNDCPET